MIAIIVSQKDPAGLNIKERLIELGFKETDEEFQGSKVYENDKAKIYTTETELIYSENLDEEIDAELFIFGSKHRSASGVNSLSVHAIGNWNKADLGGKEGKLCIVPAKLMRKAFLKLNELGKNLDYEITMEATHHGPYLEKPAMFVEIGSDLENWQNKEAGEIVAKTIMDVQNDKDDSKNVFAIGGTHYCMNLNRKVLEKNIAIGHVCPRHALEFLNKEMIKQAIEKTKDKVDFVLLDWKGLSPFKQKIIENLNELKIEYKRSDKL